MDSSRWGFHDWSQDKQVISFNENTYRNISQTGINVGKSNHTKYWVKLMLTISDPHPYTITLYYPDLFLP